MNINVRELTNKQEVMNRARITIWKDSLEKEPSTKFMQDIYMSEHSPIRDRMFVIQIRDIKSWIATHLCRHSVGYTPYISTQRENNCSFINTTKERDERPQGELVNMDITLNAQAFINVSRKRLCGKAHIETQVIWNRILECLREIDKELASTCVPECVYRGFCPERETCGRTELDFYKELRKSYIGERSVINV